MASALTFTVVDSELNNYSTLNFYYDSHEHRIIKTDSCDFRTQSKKEDNDVDLDVTCRRFSSKHDLLAILNLEEDEIFYLHSYGFKNYYQKYNRNDGASCLIKVEMDVDHKNIKSELNRSEKEAIKNFLIKSQTNKITHKIKSLCLGYRWILIVEFKDKEINENMLKKLEDDIYTCITNQPNMPETLKGDIKATMYDTYFNKIAIKSFYDLRDEIDNKLTKEDPKLLQIKLLNIDDFMTSYDIEKKSLISTRNIEPTIENKINKLKIQQNNSNQTIEKISDNCKTVLLLGESGVGKSTFINAIFNYLQFPSLDEAESSKEIENPIHAKFAYYDNKNVIDIEMGDKDDQNEKFIEGQSSTQSARAYTVPKTDLRIIDTPGMGDTRGIEVDRKNFRQTVEYLSNFEYLDCICFLIKPNNIRFGHSFKYCFKELFSNLSKSSTKNITFCFTNTRSTMYRPGDTLQPLRNFIKEVNTTFQVDIPLSYENIFCLDNEAFRYLMLVKNNVQLSTVERKEYVQSWMHSSMESKRLIDYVTNLGRMKTAEIIALNNFKFTIMDWAKDSIEFIKNLEAEIITIKAELKEQKNIRNFNKAVKEESTHYPKTARKTSETDANLKPKNNINVIANQKGRVSTAGPIRSTSSTQIPQKKSPSKMIVVTNSFYDIKNQAIEDSQISISKLESKSEEIIDQCSKLSRYVFKNSIAIFNDYFEAHIDEAIKEEENKEYTSKITSQLLERFREIKKSYCLKRKKAEIPSKIELDNIRESLFLNIQLTVKDIIDG